MQEVLEANNTEINQTVNNLFELIVGQGGIEQRITDLRARTIDSVYIADLIKTSQEPQDQGDILNTLIRVTNSKLIPRINEIQLTLDNFVISTKNKLEQIGLKLEHLGSSIEDVSDHCRDNKWSIQLQSEIVSNKADKGEIGRLERMQAHYAPLHEFRDLQKHVTEDYAKQDEFEIAQKNITLLRDSVELKANK